MNPNNSSPYLEYRDPEPLDRPPYHEPGYNPYIPEKLYTLVIILPLLPNLCCLYYSGSSNTLFGLMILIGQTIFSIIGLKLSYENLLRVSWIEEHKDRPWKQDHIWNLGGETASPRWPAVKVILQACLSFFLLLPFDVAVMNSNSLLICIVLAANLLACIYLFRGVILWFQLARFGLLRLKFQKECFTPGELFAAEFFSDLPLHEFSKIKLTLRFVEEHSGFLGFSNSSRQIYAIEYSPTPPVEGQKSVPLEFPLPNDPFKMRLSALYPNYWELEAEVTLRHSLEERSVVRFFVPVYFQETPVEAPLPVSH